MVQNQLGMESVGLQAVLACWRPGGQWLDLWHVVTTVQGFWGKRDRGMNRAL